MTPSLYTTRTLLAVAVALGLGACSSTPDCLKTQRYTQAQVFPPLKSPPGLQVPEPDPDMRIPEVDNGPVSAYENAPSSSESDIPIARCLSTPPPLSAPANAKT